MPPGDPEVLGESQSVPGAWDVRNANGETVAVTPAAARQMGLSLPAPQAAAPAIPDATPEGEAAVLQGWLRPQTAAAPAPQAPASPLDLPLEATAPAAGEQTATQGGAPDVRSWMDQALEAETGPTRNRHLAEAQRQQRMQQLATAAARGDRRAANELAGLVQSGDPEAAEIVAELDRRARAGLLPTGGGGGGRRNTQTATTRFSGPGRAPTPEEAAQMDLLRREQSDIEREQMVGLAAEADAEANALEQSAALIQRADQTLERMQRQQQQAEDLRQRELDRRGRELDRLAQEAASARLEPGRLLAKGETTNRLSAALGIALGGLGDAFTGGNTGLTTALTIIDQAIDRDIEAQRQAISSKQGAVATGSSLLAQAQARFGDARAAEAAAKDAILAQVQRQIESLGRSAQGQQQEAKLRQLMAEMEARRNALRQQALMSGLGTREVVIEERAGSGGGGRRPINFGALVRETPQVSGEDRERLATTRQQRETTLQEVDRALDLLEGTSLTGPVGSRIPLATSEEARELDRTLRRIATPLATAAFGALGNEEQLLLVAEQNGLTISNRADDIRRNLLRIRDQVRGELEAAELGVGEEAVQERAGREGTVERRVTLESGRIEDIAPSAQREVRR